MEASSHNPEITVYQGQYSIRVGYLDSQEMRSETFDSQRAMAEGMVALANALGRKGASLLPAGPTGVVK